MPTSLPHNMVTKLFLYALVYPQDSSTNLMTHSLKLLKLNSQILRQQARRFCFKERSTQRTAYQGMRKVFRNLGGVEEGLSRLS